PPSYFALALHDALPILQLLVVNREMLLAPKHHAGGLLPVAVVTVMNVVHAPAKDRNRVLDFLVGRGRQFARACFINRCARVFAYDRKSTRLNSSHEWIS